MFGSKIAKMARTALAELGRVDARQHFQSLKEHIESRKLLPGTVLEMAVGDALSYSKYEFDKVPLSYRDQPDYRQAYVGMCNELAEERLKGASFQLLEQPFRKRQGGVSVPQSYMRMSIRFYESSYGEVLAEQSPTLRLAK